MGFNPLSTMFFRGAHVMALVNPSTWERKLAVYKSFGWSEADVILASTRQPFCMGKADERIRQTLEFYVERLQWGPSFVAVRPVLLCLSLKKRVIPRCSVLSVLASKGLVSRELGSTAFLMKTEKKFVDKYVAKYTDQVPGILEVDEGKQES